MGSKASGEYFSPNDLRIFKFLDLFFGVFFFLVPFFFFNHGKSPFGTIFLELFPYPGGLRVNDSMVGVFCVF